MLMHALVGDYSEIVDIQSIEQAYYVNFELHRCEVTIGSGEQTKLQSKPLLLNLNGTCVCFSVM